MLPVDQKICTTCYSQNGSKVEKEALKEKAETNNTKSQEKKSEDEKKVKENAKEEQVAKSLTTERNLVDPISNIQNHCAVKNSFDNKENIDSYENDYLSYHFREKTKARFTQQSKELKEIKEFLQFF